MAPNQLSRRSLVSRAEAAVARRLPPRFKSSLIVLRRSRFNFGTKIDTLRRYEISPLRHPVLAGKYIAIDPEIDNFTYDLANQDELVAFLAESLDRSRNEIERYAEELASDLELRRMVRDRLRTRRWDRKHRPHFGRRVGWYIVARALAPRVIVETGIHDGLGSVLLLRALARNAEEGIDGRLISFDVDPRTGWLVGDALRKRWKTVYESTTASLESELQRVQVGMIVHDSEHTYECEHFELTTALAHAAQTIALVSDNAHATTALRDVAAGIGVDYRFFRERPRGHFYPGAGIGLAIFETESRGSQHLNR